VIEIEPHHLIRCPHCDAVNINKTKKNRCRRCHSDIYPYSNFNTEKSWAFLVTAMIAYIPANLYPILITNKFGVIEENTIMGGVISLWEHGSYPIALIIFFASMVIPIMKFLILIYLMISVKYPIKKETKTNRYKLYFFTELIGPWSMIDVFVVVLLMALIHLSSIDIFAGTAATAFAISVVFTLFAAHAFDEQLIAGKNPKGEI